MIIESLHPEKMAALVKKPKCPKDLDNAPMPDYLTSLALAIRTMDFVNWDKKNVNSLLNSEDLPDWHRQVLLAMFSDGSSMLAISCLKMYLSASKPKSFYVSNDFFNIFKAVSAENLRFCDIGKPISAYFHFPNKSLIDEDGDEYQDVYVYVGPASKYPSEIVKEDGNPPFDSSDDLISIAVVSEANCFTMTSFLPLDMNLSLLEGFKGIPHVLAKETFLVESELKSVPLVVAHVMKLLAYIGTGDADIRPFKNTFTLRGGPGSKPVKKERWKSMLEIGLVGFNWINNIQYTEEGWPVKEHLRWQRHGPKNSLVKLKVIQAHTRQRQIPLAKHAADPELKADSSCGI